MSHRPIQMLSLWFTTALLSACGSAEHMDSESMNPQGEGLEQPDAGDEDPIHQVLRLGASAKTVTIRPLADQSFCLDVAASNNKDGAIVQIYRCNGTSAQQWTQTGNFFTIFGNKCLNVKDGGTNDGTRLQIWTCDPTTSTDRNNLWSLSNNNLRWQKLPGKCLDVTNGVYGDRTPAQVWGCSAGNRNQQWAVVASGANQGSGPSGAPTTANGAGLDLPTATNDYSGIGGPPRHYSGPAANFPNDPAKWDSWNNLWQRASSQMPNTPAQTEWIRQAIFHEAQITGMDARFILAVVMQESSGNARVHTTNNGVNNPGLMQSHNGASFYDNGDGGRASIFQMIKDGCEGTRYGDGLIQGLKRSKNYFAAGRLYNSGTIDNSNLSNALGATGPYASDLANRLMGRM